MYHEILFALLGLTGDIIVLSEDPILRLPTFRIKDGYSLLNDAEKEQINQILPLGWYYQQFQHFQAQYNLTWNLIHSQLPIYKMAVAFAIQDLLQEYEDAVTELEELYNRSVSDVTPSPLSYNSFIIHLKNYDVIFPHLYRMLLQIEEENITGCQLIDYFTKCPIGNPILQEAVNRILYRLRTVLLKQIFAWMVFGDLQDDSKEFFIQAKESPTTSTAPTSSTTSLPTSYTEERMLHYLNEVRGRGQGNKGLGFEWSSGFLLRLERLPDSHITPNLASKILFTGKAMLLLQRSQSDQQQNKDHRGRQENEGDMGTGNSLFRYLSQGHSFHHTSQKEREDDLAFEEGSDWDDDEDEEDADITSTESHLKKENSNNKDAEDREHSDGTSGIFLGFSKEEIEYLDREFHSLLLLSLPSSSSSLTLSSSSSVSQFIPTLEALLSRVYDVISNRLWRYMQEEYGFLHYLHVIRNTYLLGKGELFQNILDEIYPLTFPTTLRAQLHHTSLNDPSTSNLASLPSIEEMDELLNYKILRQAAKLVGLDEDDVTHVLALHLDFSSMTIQKFNEENLTYFTRNGCCDVEYPQSKKGVQLAENIYEALNIVFNLKNPTPLSDVFTKLWSEKNNLQSSYLYNTINNPWNPNNTANMQANDVDLSSKGLIQAPRYLNGSMWFKDSKFIQKGFHFTTSFQPSWVNFNRHLTRHHPYFRFCSAMSPAAAQWPKFAQQSIVDNRESDVILGSLALCLQNDARTVSAIGKGELSRDIMSSIIIGVSFHGFIEEVQQGGGGSVHRLRCYARLYIARGSAEGSWKLPTDRHVSLHIGGAATTSSTTGGPLGGGVGGAQSTSPDDYILAEKIIDLDHHLYPASSTPLKSLSTFDKMRLEVEYVRALQYQQSNSAASVKSGGSTIFSEYQKRVQLTGDVTYRLRVRLINEEVGKELTSSQAGSDNFTTWDLELPLDLTLYVKLAGGQCYVGTVTSGLHFPTTPATSTPPTIDHIHPRLDKKPEATSSSVLSTAPKEWDESFFVRQFALSFSGRSNVTHFPICSAFTSTRFPATQLRLEREVTSMRAWCSMKLRYSFHSLLKVIFDIESIRNYERVFSLIMKVRMVSRLLEKLWMIRSNWMTMMMSDRIFSHLRHAMHFFLSNLLYYLQVDVVDSEYSELLREIETLQSLSTSSAHQRGNYFLSSTSAASTSSNDFQVVLRIHKKFLANIVKLSMVDHLGIQETLDRLLHLCLRFIACCRVQSEAAESSDIGARDECINDVNSSVYLPSEELDSIEKEFYQQLSFLFQAMKTLDSRGFLFRLDFNNFLSSQIMLQLQNQHSHLQQRTTISQNSR